jgi:ketopantoate reductase
LILDTGTYRANQEWARFQPPSPTRYTDYPSDAQLSGTRFDARLSEAILQEMWEKWVFIATAAGITCPDCALQSVTSLQRAPAELATGLFDECAAIAGVPSFLIE